MTSPRHRCPKCGHEGNTDSTFLHEWSRHYDTLQWTVGGILFAGIGAAYIYIRDHFSMHIGIAAVLLTLVSMFFATGLREFRKRVHSHIPASETFILRNPWKLKLWHANFFTHVAILATLIRYLWLRKPEAGLLWLLIALGSAVVVVWLLIIERREPAQNQRLQLRGEIMLSSKHEITFEGATLNCVDTLLYKSSDDIRVLVLGPVEIKIVPKDPVE